MQTSDIPICAKNIKKYIELCETWKATQYIESDNDTNNYNFVNIILRYTKKMRSSHNLLLIKKKKKSLRKQLYLDVRYNKL